MQQSKSKKTKRICKSKKELKQFVQSLPSEIQEMELEYQVKQQQPLQFYDICTGQSIGYEVSSTPQKQITLNRKLQKKTEWRLRMCSISCAAQFGVCEVLKKNKKIGESYGLFSAGYWPARNIQTGHQFNNDTWMKLTYDPQENSLQFFNESTKKYCTFQIPEKNQDFDYYPYVFLYKATVYLNQQPDNDPFSAEDYDRMYQEMYKDEIEAQKRKQMEAQKKFEHPTVYIAGQIQKSDRRFGLVDNVLSHDEKRNPEIAPLRKMNVFGFQYLYTGPYILACHHLCTRDNCRSDKVYFPDIVLEKSQQVFERSKDGIQKAEYLVAWIENDKCFGTITELGYAHSLGKKIYIAYGPQVQPNSDLWFVFRTSTMHKKFLVRQKGMKWCFQMINQDLGLAKPNQSLSVCYGCSSNDCPLRKKNIKHCWKCGEVGYYITDCPLCKK